MPEKIRAELVRWDSGRTDKVRIIAKGKVLDVRRIYGSDGIITAMEFSGAKQLLPSTAEILSMMAVISGKNTESNVLRAEENTEVSGNQNVYTLKKTVTILNLPEEKPVSEMVFTEKKEGADPAYIRVTAETPSMPETTVLEHAISATSYALISQLFTADLWGIYVTFRFYTKTDVVTTTAYEQTTKFYGPTETAVLTS